jgi:hypothetical protein
MSFSPLTSPHDSQVTQNSNDVDINKVLLQKNQDALTILENPPHPCLDLLRPQALGLSIENFENFLAELEENRWKNLQDFLNLLEETLKTTGHKTKIKKSAESLNVIARSNILNDSLYPTQFIFGAISLVHMNRRADETYPCPNNLDFATLCEESYQTLHALSVLVDLLKKDDFSNFRDALLAFDEQMNALIECAYPLFANFAETHEILENQVKEKIE